MPAGAPRRERDLALTAPSPRLPVLENGRRSAVAQLPARALEDLPVGQWLTVFAYASGITSTLKVITVISRERASESHGMSGHV